MRCLLLVLAVALEDTSIVFPEFFGSEAVSIGGHAQPQELDGVTLQALVIAANDFLPPDSRERSCWDRQDSYRYRVIKQDGIVFVEIGADPDACRPAPRMLDGGVKYAISTDGRILRRLFDGEPETPTAPEVLDGGPPASPSIPVGDTTRGKPQPLPSRFLDGGITLQKRDDETVPIPRMTEQGREPRRVVGPGQ
jgi:hypothetical protein